MVGKYGVTANGVRDIMGLDAANDIDDDTVERFITDFAEEDAEHACTTVWTMEETLEVVEMEFRQHVLMLDTTPIGRLLDVQVNLADGDAEDVATNNVQVDRNTGKLTLGSDANRSNWYAHSQGNNAIRLTYGSMDEDKSVATTTSSDVSAAPRTQTTVSVDDDLTSDLSSGDYVRIQGMDGADEVTEVQSVSASSIDVAGVSLDHTSGSRVVKMVTPELAKQLVRVLAAIYCASYKIGGTQDFQSGYALGDLDVQKGEPYPPFKQLLPDLKTERDRLIAKLKRPVVV